MPRAALLIDRAALNFDSRTINDAIVVQPGWMRSAIVRELDQQEHLRERVDTVAEPMAAISRRCGSRRVLDFGIEVVGVRAVAALLASISKEADAGVTEIRLRGSCAVSGWADC